MKEQTVFIVDDDVAVCDSIQELVESVGLRAESYTSGQEFLDHYQPERSGCLVLDVRMAGMSGLVLHEKLKERGNRIPVIIITGHADVPMAVHALKAGAVDFVQKPYRNQLLLDSINNALTIDSIARRSLDEAQECDRQLAKLTRREQEVLDNLLAGSSSKQIARELGISTRTVETHRQNLLRKLGIGSITELMLHPIAREKRD
jgi:FixJ family two-component response regulator